MIIEVPCTRISAFLLQNFTFNLMYYFPFLSEISEQRVFKKCLHPHLSGRKTQTQAPLPTEEVSVSNQTHLFWRRISMKRVTEGCCQGLSRDSEAGDVSVKRSLSVSDELLFTDNQYQPHYFTSLCTCTWRNRLLKKWRYCSFKYRNLIQNFEGILWLCQLSKQCLRPDFYYFSKTKKTVISASII